MQKGTKFRNPVHHPPSTAVLVGYKEIDEQRDTLLEVSTRLHGHFPDLNCQAVSKQKDLVARAGDFSVQARYRQRSLSSANPNIAKTSRTTFDSPCLPYRVRK